MQRDLQRSALRKKCGPASAGGAVRAAQYVRMSTEHQRYSTENQRAAIGAYAVHRDIEIVRTYEDMGRSGLRLEGRPALQELLAAVQERRADFDLVLVYDVSRWGRFQDADESAHYEFLCRKAGVEVRYCAEVFENDGSITATLLKTMKRAMAGEYSRELSEKVAAGHRRLAERGYWQGGDPGFGLRRALIKPDGTILQPMERGQRKAIQDFRTTIVAGPPHEAEAVRWMYNVFTQQSLGETAIAKQLNRERIQTPEGGPWTRRRVHGILTKPRYAGILVYNRTSERLTGARVANARDRWVEREGAFEALIPLQTFRLAQRRLESRRSRSNAELIEALRRIHAREGRVTRALIRDDPQCPASSVFAERFGSLMKAYRVAGLTAVKDIRYLDGLHLRRRLLEEAIQQLGLLFDDEGVRWRVNSTRDLFILDGTLRLAISIVRCSPRVWSAGSSPSWKLFNAGRHRNHLYLVGRMTPGNDALQDFYLVPRPQRPPSWSLWIDEEATPWLRGCRFADLLEAATWLRRRTAVRKLKDRMRAEKRRAVRS